MTIGDEAFNRIKHTIDKNGVIRDTYAQLWKLSSINGVNISGILLDRMMYSFESLPPLGKEYWWFLFFGQDRRQMMLLMFRQYGRSMVFNRKQVRFKKIDPCTFQAVTAGWIYDGKVMHDLRVTNPIIRTNPREKTIISQISNRKMILKGSFPEYELKLDGLVDLKMTKGDFLENRGAHGIFIPPFGVGWVDVYSKTKGNVLGEGFEGTAHLQKVVGVMPYGSFHWARVIFQNGSTTSFFCLKIGKGSKIYLPTSMNFYDHRTKRFIRFNKPKLRISKKRGEVSTWIIKGWDKVNELTMVLEAYTEKKFTMKGGGSQVYIQYAVTLSKFNFTTKNQSITLQDLGEGVGTFEDAYGSLAS